MPPKSDHHALILACTKETLNTKNIIEYLATTKPTDIGTALIALITRDAPVTDEAEEIAKKLLARCRQHINDRVTHIAAANGFFELTKELANKNSIHTVIDTCSISAKVIGSKMSSHKKIELLSYFIEKLGLNLKRSSNEEGDSLLHYAVAVGELAIAEKLLTLGIPVNCQNNKKQTPLMLVMSHPKKEKINPLVRLLLSHQANINAQDNLGDTALHVAISFECEEAAQELLAAGTDITIINHKHQTAVFFAKHRSGKILEIFKTHIDALQDTTTKVKAENTLCNTRAEKKILWTKFINEQGGLEKINLETQTDLVCFAAQVGDIDMITILATQGMNVNIKTKDGITPLHYAAYENQPLALKALLDYQADPNSLDSHKNTALHLAAAGDYFECVQALLAENMTNPNLTNALGISALHVAKDPRIIDLLIHTSNQETVDATAELETINALDTGNLTRLEHLLCPSIPCKNKADPQKILNTIWPLKVNDSCKKNKLINLVATHGAKIAKIPGLKIVIKKNIEPSQDEKKLPTTDPKSSAAETTRLEKEKTQLDQENIKKTAKKKEKNRRLAQKAKTAAKARKAENKPHEEEIKKTKEEKDPKQTHLTEQMNDQRTTQQTTASAPNGAGAFFRPTSHGRKKESFGAYLARTAPDNYINTILLRPE